MIREFIEAPRPAGLQTSIAFIRQALAGEEVLAVFEGLNRGAPGGANNL